MVRGASRSGGRTSATTRFTLSRSATRPSQTSTTAETYQKSTGSSPRVQTAIHSGRAAANAHPRNSRLTSRRASPGRS